jgi:hypothetical protein
LWLAPRFASADQLTVVNVRYNGTPSAYGLAVVLNNTPSTVTPAPVYGGGVWCSPSGCGIVPKFLPPVREGAASLSTFSSDPANRELFFDRPVSTFGGTQCLQINNGGGDAVGWVYPDGLASSIENIRWTTGAPSGGANCAGIPPDVEIPSSTATAYTLTGALIFTTPPPGAARIPIVPLSQLGPNRNQVASGTSVTATLPVSVSTGQFVVVSYDTEDPGLSDGTVSTRAYIQSGAAPSAGKPTVKLTNTFVNQFTGAGQSLWVKRVKYAVVSTALTLDQLNDNNSVLASQLSDVVPAASSVPAMHAPAKIALGVLLVLAGAFAVVERRRRSTTAAS